MATPSTSTAAKPGLTAGELARRTPDSRDRYVDFLRIFSIVVVVLGHWLMAVVTWDDDTFRTGNVIGLVPGLWAATWVLQVMPLFFFVGGFANAVTIDAFRRRGLGASEFVASRVRRLIVPVAVLLAVWLPAAVALEHLGMPPRVLHSATKLVCQPLWFIGVYLLVVSLAPLMRDLHTRFRVGALIGLAASIVLVDVARFALGLGAIGYVNVLSVWLFAQQLGFFYADGSLAALRRTTLAMIGATAVVVLAILTTCGPYPHSMVGLPGERVSNMSPPTLCLVALAVFQVCVVMLLRPVAQGWLARPRVWTAVIAGNGVIMTTFLWHLTALLVALSILHAVGFPQPEGGAALWWLTRPVVILLAVAPLVVFIQSFGRVERPRPAEYRARNAASGTAVGTGVALLAIATFGVASSNVVDLLDGTRVHLAVVGVTSLQILVCALCGWSLIGTAVRRSSLTH